MIPLTTSLLTKKKKPVCLIKHHRLLLKTEKMNNQESRLRPGCSLRFFILWVTVVNDTFRRPLLIKCLNELPHAS